MKHRPILVSEATRNPGLALIRELGRAGFQVQGADERRLPMGLHSRYSPPYLCYGTKPGSQLSGSLLELVSRFRPKVFLPVSTTTTEIVCRERARFEDLTHVNVPPYEAFLTAVDNERTLRACAGLGIPCPRLFNISEAIEFLSSTGDRNHQRRIAVKPKRDLGAARGVHFVTDPTAMKEAIDSNAQPFGESVLQEYIPGDAQAMRLALLLFDRNGSLLVGLTSKKILQWPETGGISALAVSTHEPDLVDLVRPFFESVGWRGAAEVELKRDPRDGSAKVIEINPRVPSYMGFPERCGLPLASMLVEAATSTSSISSCSSYEAGVPFFRTGDLLQLLLGRFRHPESGPSLAALLWSHLRAGAKPASLDLTDPLPRIGKLLFELTATLRGHTETRHYR